MLRPFHFRGKYRLVDPLVPRQGERIARLFGLRVKLNLADDMQRWVYLGIYEPYETECVRRRLKPGMVFLDIGANIGYFTVLAAPLVGPTGRVISVEPSVHVARQLIETVRVNGLKQVQVEPIGLSDQTGELNLFVPPVSMRNHSPSMVDWPDSGWVPEKVPVRTLDDCLDQWKVDRIDLMKIDVEGHEPAVFRGAARALASGRIREILCEFNDVALHGAGSSSGELYDLLLGSGFRDAVPSLPRPGEALVTRNFVFKGS